MELKHLRKNKIAKIKTEVLENELNKLESRRDIYQATIEEKEPIHRLLKERLIESGEGLDTWRGRIKSELKEWSDDKETYHMADNDIRNAQHGLKKTAEKKRLIEQELVDRLLTGEK
jgi:hypothetical protein